MNQPPRPIRVLYPRRAEVWIVDLDPVVGHEQGGRRSALIVSSDLLHAIPSQLAFVVPLTSRDRQVRAHVPIVPPEGGLTKPSFALTEQLRSVSTDRLHRRVGTVSAATLEEVMVRIGLFLEF